MKIKKFISLLAATTMALTAFTNVISASALRATIDDFDLNTPYTSGMCGENSEWLINSDGVLVISGTGEMSTPYKNPSTGTKVWGWRKLGNDVKEITVKNGITVGGLGAFSPGLCKYVSKIILPPSMTKLNGCISPDAGQYVNLKDIYVYSKDISDASTLYNSMYSAWSNSEKIWHVYQGSTTETSLRNDLKLTDDNIMYIPYDEQMPTVNNKTPAELEPVTDTKGPSGLTSKYEWDETSRTLTFRGTGVISIADNYQKYAKKTEHIVIKEGITTIFAYTGVLTRECITGAFYGFKALKDVELPDTLTSIEELSFYETPMTDINFPENLEKIGTLAFFRTNLEEISIPKSLKEIGESAFEGTKIKTVNFHEGMTIGGSAFQTCNLLTEVTIPKNTNFLRRKIGGQGMSREHSTFLQCVALEKIVIEDGCKITDSWSNVRSENGIPDLFCQGCTKLKTVIIKGNVEYIPNNSFQLCPSLNDIYFYNTGLTTITSKDTVIGINGNADSIDTTNNPTFHVVQGSTTEQTLKDAGYLNDDNTKYIPNINELQSAIDEAEKIDTSKYSDNTLINNLKTALENANSVRDNLNATQEDVDAAAKALNDAISALTKPNTSVTPTSPTTKPSTTRSPEVVKKDKDTAKELMKQAKITKLKVKSTAKKKINVNWKKVKKAVGYQVQVSKKQNFKKKIINKFTTKKKFTITKKIKSGKTYFVRVRAYATYKDAFGKPQKVYSKWNKKLRKVKVK